MANTTYASSDLFLKALYDRKTKSIPGFLELYEKLLLERGDERSVLHANRLEQYRKEITNRKYLNELKKDFNSLYLIISKEYPDLKFLIEGRIKSVVSTDKKIVKNLNENKSLDLLRDTIAFRTLIFGNYSTSELIEFCYGIMNSIIKYGNSSYTLCEADDVKNTMDLTEEHEGIIIPKKSLINPRYLFGVKDYILTPKKNGYQSLHAVFRRQKGGECFEVQVRTFDMHLFAENGEASHSNYKKSKYKTPYNIERNKIHIPGYSVANDGTVFDFVGLEKGLQIIKQQRVF